MSACPCVSRSMSACHHPSPSTQSALNEGGKLLWIAPSGGRDRRIDPVTGAPLLLASFLRLSLPCQLFRSANPRPPASTPLPVRGAAAAHHVNDLDCCHCWCLFAPECDPLCHTTFWPSMCLLAEVMRAFPAQPMLWSCPFRRRRHACLSGSTHVCGPLSCPFCCRRLHARLL